MKLLLNQSNIQEWANYRIGQCHGIAKAAGWWTDLATGEPKQRNIPEMLALIHSEISEAYMGTGGMDDKLPMYQGDAVEIIDTLVRIFDMIGGLNEPVAAIAPIFASSNARNDAAWLYAEAHKHTTHLLEAFRRNKPRADLWANLISWMVYCFNTVSYAGQLDTVLDAKLAFNQQRADHKPENRKLADGKKY